MAQHQAEVQPGDVDDPRQLAAEADRAWQAGHLVAAARLRLRTLRALLALMHDVEPDLDEIHPDAARDVHEQQDEVIEALIAPDVWPVGHRVARILRIQGSALGLAGFASDE